VGDGVYLLQSDTELPAALKAIQDQFRQGGTLGSVVLTVLGFVAVLAIVFAIDRAMRRARERPEPKRARRLFRDLMVRLQLSVPDCELLRRMADELQLAQPVVLLLCPELFAELSRRWRERAPSRSADAEARLAALAGRLFPVTGDAHPRVPSVEPAQPPKP